MIKKFGKLILIAVTAVILTLSFAACKESETPSPSPTAPADQITVVEAVSKLLSALENTADYINSTDIIYIDTTAVLNLDGVQYEFTLKANIEPSGEKSRNNENKISFEVLNNSSVYLGLYYLNGILYLDLPINGGEGSEKIYINNLYFSDIIANLQMDDFSDNNAVRNLIASFIDEVSYSVEGDVETLVFTMDLKEAFNTLFSFISTQYEGFNLDSLLGMIGLSPDSLDSELEQYDGVELTVVIDEEYFSRFSYDNKTDTTLSMTSFDLTSGAGIFTVPIDTEDFSEYSPTNVDISGTLSLDVSEGDFLTQIGDVDINSSFVQAEYQFDFRLRAKISLLAPSENRILLEISAPDEYNISIYYDGAADMIYSDLSDLNAGQIKMSGAKLTELINSMATEIPDSEEAPAESGFDGSLNSVLKLVGIVAPGISLTTESVEVVFDTQRFRDFFEALGIALPLDIEEAGARIDRENYDVNSISAWLSIGGMTLSVEADEVTVGPSPVVPVPTGLNSYLDSESIDVFTAYMDGTLNLVTGQENLLAFIEGALSNIAGEEVDLALDDSPSGTTIKYTAKVGIDAIEGTIDSIQIELLDNLDNYIAGVTYLASTQKIYIIEEETLQGSPVYTYEEYDLSFDITEMIKLITGLTNPAAPTDEGEISFGNTLSTFTAVFNYRAVYLLTEYLRNTLFSSEEVLSGEYIFDSLSLTIGDGFIGRVDFPNNKSITITSERINFSYDPVTITGVVESTSKSVSSVYLDNSMPTVMTLRYSDASTKKFEVKEWTYSNLGSLISSAGGTVNAYTHIMGYRVDYTISVAPSSISTLIPPSNEIVNGFNFNKNDISINPVDYIRDFDTMTLRLNSSDVVKALYWDLSSIEGENDNGTYNIQGYVYDFFGRRKKLPGDEQYYTVTLTGTDIISHDLDRTLDAYSGIDPTKNSSYPEAAVLTAGGLITIDPSAQGELVNLEWDLSNIIAAFSAAGFNAYEQGLDIDVSVNIPNSLGTSRTFDVNVKVNPAVMTGLSFEDVYLGNGKLIDENLNTSSSASGIYWDDGEGKLVINPMRIRALSEAILPASVIMHTANGDFTFSGLKWQFLPLEITNQGGQYDDYLILIIGDKIGGYQEATVPLEVVTVTINNFEILNNAEEVLLTDDVDTLYKHYEIINPYSYDMPVKTRVFTTLGEFVLTTSWSFPTFNPALIYNGGTYEGTYQAGSQQLKVRITIDPTISVMDAGLTFRNPEDTTIDFNAEKGLVFNPYTSADFTDVEIYPVTGLATFTDGEGNARQLEVPLRWDISAITALYAAGNPNMYLGKSITVKAFTDYPDCGTQQFNVDIYIEEAIIDTNAAVFSIGNPTKIFELSIFGDEGGHLTFIDPRITDSYPETIYVSYLGADLPYPARIIPMNPEDVEVSWDISSIIEAYNEVNIISGISGLYDIVATVGTSRGGYQTVTMQVNITSAELSNVLFLDIPLLQDGNSAFVYDDTEGANYIATFTYDPYASNIKNSISYPATMSFDLEIESVIHSFTEQLNWDLASVQDIEPYQGGTYLVNARLPLSDTGYLPVPVRIEVNQKIADTLNGEGLFNIFIDPLDETPFGRRNYPSYEVKQTVTVTFTGDETEMTLNLVYSRENIFVDFGGNLYLVDAYVGNDFGGYQPIGMDGKIQVAIVQREITSIKRADDNLELYRRDEIEHLDGSGNVYYEISEVKPNILYYESKPQTMLFSFTGIDDPVEVPLRNAGSTGLCYDWIDVDATHAEIKIYNIIPEFFVNGEDAVFIGNPVVSIDVVKLIDVNGILITQGDYRAAYIGVPIDILTELNTLGAILNDELGIGTEFLEYEYYYDGQIIEAADVLNAGVYTLRIYVKGHTVYGGYDEVIYTIDKIDISSNIRIFRGALQVNETGGNVVESLQYNGSPIEYTADAFPYTLSVDIIYPDGTAPLNVGVYNISVQVNPQHLNEICYNTITLTVTKVFLDENSEDVDITYTQGITYGTSDFDISLTSYGIEIEDFTYGFYTDAECTSEIQDISVLDVGLYFIKVVYIGDNYDINAVVTFNIIPATIPEEEIIFSASSMGVGETGPALTLTVMDEVIDLSSVTPSYYSDSACTTLVPDISAAGEGQYWVKVVVEIDNYIQITPVATFWISVS